MAIPFSFRSRSNPLITASTTISDDVDVTTVTLSATPAVAEGGSITYTATLDNPAETALTITLSNGAVINNPLGATFINTFDGNAAKGAGATPIFVNDELPPNLRFASYIRIIASLESDEQHRLFGTVSNVAYAAGSLFYIHDDALVGQVGITRQDLVTVGLRFLEVGGNRFLELRFGGIVLGSQDHSFSASRPTEGRNMRRP